MPEPIRHGDTPLPPPPPPPDGRLDGDGGEPAYVIDHAEAMAPFLVSVVSSADHWLYASSTGALTAGRRNPSGALFPYVTEDKIHDAAGVTGPRTSLLVDRGDGPRLWRPLLEADRRAWPVARRLVKPVLGHRLAWEEENPRLGLRFRAEWRTSARHGFVRACTLTNAGAAPVTVRLLDGLLNLLPADVDEPLQTALSCLVDAYKRSERVPGGTLALYTLAAQVVDRPEPRESLHATTAWCHGLPGARIHLDAAAFEPFEAGAPLAEPEETRGRRGAYLVEAALRLAPGAAARWVVVADVGRSQAEVASLRRALAAPAALAAEVEADVAEGARRLRRLVGATDGLQVTEDAAAAAHHAANVLFNDLRGGLFAHGHHVPGPDLAAFVARANREAHRRHRALLDGLPALAPREEVLARLEAAGDPDLARLGLEYLPITFSRRHGDPSRPWNRFDVQPTDAAGRPRIAYQGNWRDIFQNWEALSLSHPAFVEGMVARFVNASTADGHNPYRISSDGVDWEVPDPGHPWSGIGYWGDHQLVYLLRLLQRSRALRPGALPALLERPIFTYADVPYRLAPFERLLADPHRTITFDEAGHARALARARALGADGRLLPGAAGPHRVTLLEKLLVPALAKLAAFVPGGGVWMNTGRPEWNDANNALVGWGLSVVTLCHLERYLAFLPGLLAPLAGRETALSPEVAAWAEATRAALARHERTLAGPGPSDAERLEVLRALGEPASRYREEVYRRGLSAPAPTPVAPLLELVARAAAAARRGVEANRREDGLFHAYNLLAPRPGGLGVERLPVMLEGQVAALGALDPAGACALLDALRASPLWREDQRSYLLYPDRALPRFLEKNVVPEEALRRAPLLARLLEAGDRRVLARDADGRLRFDGRLHHAAPVREALLALRAEGFPGVDDGAVAAVLEVYEETFRHRAFTGRSGSMFAYEGLGSIYWHMVAKLLLAVQEQAFAAADAGAPAEVLARLRAHYWAIRDGLGGVRKGPAGWGAFPLDPYSHSPADGPARQPGMTGQVKEEVLARLGELGLVHRDGRVAFQPALLRADELLRAPGRLEHVGLDGEPLVTEVPAGALAFTLCQVPVVVRRAEGRPAVTVTWADGRRTVCDGPALDEAASTAILGRTGQVRRVDAALAIPG